MNHRIDLLRNLPPAATVAEIGVMAGNFMHDIWEARPDLTYYGVDTWEGRFETYYQGAIKTAFGKPQLHLIRMPSVQAATKFPDGFFDLVYIDALHTRQAVLDDIAAWHPKVKKGGILAGHDYEMKPPMDGWEAIEVKEAVDNWAAQMLYSVNVIQETAPSWWIQRAQR